MRIKSQNVDDIHTAFLVRALELDDKGNCSQMGGTVPAGYVCSMKQHRHT